MKQLQTKEESIQTVKENNESYYCLAYNYACKWVAEKVQPFTSEDLSKDMYLILGYPDELRVLGPVFVALKNENRIKFHGYMRYKAKQGHGKPATVWISREYSLKQAKNASKEQTLNLFEQLCLNFLKKRPMKKRFNIELMNFS